LKVTVMDWNRIVAHKPLGDVTISLKSFTGRRDAEYPLTLKGKQQGKVKIELNITNEQSALRQEIESSVIKIRAMEESLVQAENTLKSDLLKEPEAVVVDSHGKLVIEGVFRGREFLDWDEFSKLIARNMRARGQDIDELRPVLDRNRDGRVQRGEFEHFFKWFNPITAEEKYKRTTRIPASDVVVKEWTIGAVAELMKQAWFHPLVDGDTAEDKLKNQPPGTFLIRFSGSQPGGYAISMRMDKAPPNHCDQWKINPVPGSSRLAIFDEKYNNLYHIVETHKVKHLEDDPSIPLLKQPCPK